MTDKPKLEDLELPAPTVSEAHGLILLHKLLTEDTGVIPRLAKLPTEPVVNGFMYVLRLADLCAEAAVAAGLSPPPTEEQVKTAARLLQSIDQSAAHLLDISSSNSKPE